MINATVVILLIVVAVFAVLFYFVSRAGNTASFYEEVYARQVAMFIDSSKVGATISFDVGPLVAAAYDKSVEPEITVNCNINTVTVKATKSQGSTYEFFTPLKECVYSFDKANRRFSFRVI